MAEDKSPPNYAVLDNVIMHPCVLVGVNMRFEYLCIDAESCFCA